MAYIVTIYCVFYKVPEDVASLSLLTSDVYSYRVMRYSSSGSDFVTELSCLRYLLVCGFTAVRSGAVPSNSCFL